MSSTASRSATLLFQTRSISPILVEIPKGDATFSAVREPTQASPHPSNHGPFEQRRSRVCLPSCPRALQLIALDPESRCPPSKGALQILVHSPFGELGQLDIDLTSIRAWSAADIAYLLKVLEVT